MPRTQHSPFIQEVIHRVERFLFGQLELASGSRVIVAVSGGVDSIVLLDVLLTLVSKHSLAIAVAHFNHRLRTTATRDETFVKRLATRHNLTFFSGTSHVSVVASRDKISLEMAGRNERYDFFRQLLDTQSFDCVATAHTRTDNAETVILNLARGGGLNSLAGIPQTRAAGSKKIIRPLLCLDKTEIITYAKERKLKWREDTTNLDRRIPRNRVRRDILPQLEKLNPRFSEAIERSSTVVKNTLQYLRPDIDHAKETLVKSAMQGTSLSIAIQPLKGYFGFLQSIALHEILRETFPDVLFGAADIDRVVELTERQTGNRAQIVGSLVALRDRSTIIISRASNAPIGPTPLVIGKRVRFGEWSVSAQLLLRKRILPRPEPGTEFVDADIAGETFVLRTWQPGDAFTPLGMQSKKKLSDFLTDSKVSSATRRIVPVLIANDKIIWVCGYRIDHRVRITDHTTRLLKLSITKESTL